MPRRNPARSIGSGVSAALPPIALRVGGKKIYFLKVQAMICQAATPHLLLFTPVPPAMRATLEQRFALHDDALLDEAERRALSTQVRALLCNAQSVVSKEQMRQWPALELICVIGVGMDGIDLEAAAERNITVRNTPDVSTEDIADHTMALLLAATRKVVQAHRFVQQGEWARERFAPTPRFWGRRLGIVGLGRIGRAVARRAQAFDLSIAYTGRSPKSDVAYHWYADVEALANHVDFLVVCASGGAETQGMINAAVLEALGPDGVLVNIGRGSIVDEVALQHALLSRTIAAAALDVFANEPQVPQALCSLSNVVVTPHMASSTQQGLQTMVQQAQKHLLEHFSMPEVAS